MTDICGLTERNGACVSFSVSVCMFLVCCTVFDTHSGSGLPLKQLSLNRVERNAIRHVSSTIHHWLLWIPQGEERREWPIDIARNARTHTRTHTTSGPRCPTAL